jgi:hypothetical protein
MMKYCLEVDREVEEYLIVHGDDKEDWNPVAECLLDSCRQTD